MVGGILGATLALIVFYAVVQPGAAKRGTQATDVLVNTVTRFGSPGVAGVGDRSRSSAVKGTGGSSSGPFFQPVQNV